MKKHLVLLVAVAVVIATTGSFASANLLTNGGFEGAPIASGPPPFTGRWEPFSLDGDQGAGGDLAFTSTSSPLSGVQHMQLEIVNTPNSFAGAFQDVSGLFPGQIGTFSGWSQDLGADAGGTEIRIEWRDSVADSEISRTGNLVPALVPGQYTPWSLTDTVPAGADSARVVYAIQSFGAGPNQHINVDDTSFTIVPEPTAALLALFGLAPVAIRRR
jgi:hypothetical protein